jgi:DNA-binding response OmpR family regulator
MERERLVSEPAQILVVDDEASIRITLEALLRRCGYAVTLAATGAEALAQIEQREFDLFLLDLILPGTSGHELARQARARQPAAAILFLTGSDALAELEMSENEYILKTTSPQEVLARVAATIAEKQCQVSP